MESLSVQMSFRPVRVGWCVRAGNLEDLEQAFRLSSCLWGGTANPIITTTTAAEAEGLIRLFQLDALFPAVDDRSLGEFVERFRWLRWPKFERGSVFLQRTGGLTPQLLDLTQCMLRFEEYQRRRRLKDEFKPTIIKWERSDPLSMAFLAMFGAFPETTSIHYEGALRRRLDATTVDISDAPALPADLFQRATPAALTQLGLRPDASRHPHASALRQDGVYLGDASSFEDLVNFWNLRAAGKVLLFDDEAHHSRLAPLQRAFIDFIKEGLRSGWDEIHVWFAESDTERASDRFGKEVVWSPVSQTTWNGLNVIPRVLVFDSVVGEGFVTTSQPDTAARLTLSLPEKPFSDENWASDQHVMVTVSTVTKDWRDRWTFMPPCVPKLNERYSRKMLPGEPWSLRVEPQGLAVLQGVSRNNLRLHGLDFQTAIGELFRGAGLRVTASESGLLALRLIQQMGGLQGCRVFKISGVRALMNEFSHHQPFTRKEAMGRIGPGLDRFHDLFIEYREHADLRAQDVFDYLVRKRIVRAGQRLRCPHCDLRDWFSLDALGSVCRCEFCGEGFDPTVELGKSAWYYRRSSLCGKEGNEGSLPAILVLQQLDTALGMGLSRMVSWATGSTILMTDEAEPLCEADILVVLNEQDGQVAVLLGEVKTGTEIDARDVANLSRVGGILEAELGVVPYLLFAKMKAFTSAEIELCRKAPLHLQERVILLEEKQLEPYGFYEWTSGVPQEHQHVLNVSDLAKATRRLFFEGAES